MQPENQLQNPKVRKSPALHSYFLSERVFVGQALPATSGHPNVQRKECHSAPDILLLQQSLRPADSVHREDQ